jgi:hypothetical protein
MENEECGMMNGRNRSRGVSPVYHSTLIRKEAQWKTKTVATSVVLFDRS